MIFSIKNLQNIYYLGASAGTDAPRNTHKIKTQCGCEYGCKNPGSLVTLSKIFLLVLNIVSGLFETLD